MRNARSFWRAIVVVSLLAASALFLSPAATGRPFVTYASSGSMEPTIGVFDVFFVEPWPAQISVGDIVVFRSVSHDGPAVHRIVGGDEGSWTTQGDANLLPDQQGGEPPLTRDRNLGRVVTNGRGEPILLENAAIPFLEANARLVHAQQVASGSRPVLAIGFLAIAILFGVLAIGGGKKRHERSRPMSRRVQAVLRHAFPRGILGKHVGWVLLIVVFVSTAWVAAHARSDVEVTIVVVDDEATADTVRAAALGGALPRDIEVRSLGSLPTRAYVAGDQQHIEAVDQEVSIAPRATAVLRVMQRAQGDPGLQTDTVEVWRYPAFLPHATLTALHDLAPGAPYFAFAALAGLAGATWFGTMGIARLPVGRMLGVREDWR
jgi:signal peptidase